MTLVINTVSDSTKAQKDLADLKKSVSGIETSVQKVTDKFGKLATSIAAAGAAFATGRALLEMSDTMTNLENKIKAVSTSTDQYKKALQGVKDLALSTRTDMAATAALYQRIAINQKEIGINTKDTLRVVEIVNKSMKIAGASTAEATSALLQFGQALGSGKLQGDELRSLAESAPTLFKAIADGVGIPIGKMKKFGEEGKLVTSVIIPAILKAGLDVDKTFGGLAVTYGDAFKNLGTGFTQLKDSASKYFFGSKSVLATWLNDIAMSAGRVAKYFSYYMTLARSYVDSFIFGTVILFKRLWPAISDTAKRIGEIVIGLFDKWKPELQKAAGVLRQWLGQIGAVFTSTFSKLGEELRGNSLFAPLIDSFYIFKDFLVNAFKSIWNSISGNTIDVASFFKNFEPVKKMVLSFVKTLERAFFWLYDRVIGHSWIPDLVEGVEEWTGKLLKKPLDFVESFSSKVSKLFETISSPLNGKGFAGFVDVLKDGVFDLGKVLEKLGSVFKGNTSFFDRISNKIKDLIKPKSTIDKLKDRFKDAVRPKTTLEKATERVSSFFKGDNTSSSLVKNLKSVMSVESPFQKIKDGISTVFETILSGIGGAIETIVKVIPAKLQVPLAIAATSAFAYAMSTLSSNPAVKTGLLALGAAIGFATSAKFLDPNAVSEAAFGFANTVLSVLANGIGKLIGGNAFTNPFDLVTLLAKFALLFAAGRKFLGEAAGKLLQAPTKLGQNLGAKIDLKVAQKEEDKLTKALTELPAKLSKALVSTSSTRQLRQNDLVALRAQQLTARANGTQGPDQRVISAALLASRQARGAETTAKADFNNFGNLEKTIKNGINDQKTRGDQIKLALRESGEKFRESFRTNTGALGGLVGGVGGLQLGTQFLSVIPNAPEWVKVATVIATGFIGQVIGSTIGSGIASAVTYAFQNASSLFTRVLSVTPWWLQMVLGLSAALYIGYQLFKSLPEEWTKGSKVKENITKFTGVGAKDNSLLKDVLLSAAWIVGAIAAFALAFQGALALGAMGVAGVMNVAGRLFFGAISNSLLLLRSFGDKLVGMVPAALSSLIARVTSFSSTLFSTTTARELGRNMSAVPGIGKWVKALLFAIFAGVGAAAFAEEAPQKGPAGTNAGRKIKDGFYVDDSGIPLTKAPDSEIQKSIDNAGRDKEAGKSRGSRSAEFAPTFIENSMKSFTDMLSAMETKFAGNKMAMSAISMLKGSTQQPGNTEVDYKGETARVLGNTIEKSFSSSMKGMSNTAIGATFANYLNNNGFKNVAGEDIAGAADRNPASVGMLSTLIDRLANADAQTKELGGKTTPWGASADQAAGRIRREIDNFMIQSLDLKEPASKLKNQADGEDDKQKKGKYDHFQDLFANITKMFPELNLTLEQFLDMQEESAIALSNLAQASQADITALNSKIVGKKLEGTLTPEDFKETKANEDLKKERLKAAKGIVRPTRSSLANLSPLFAEVQLGLADDVIQALKDGTLKGLEESAEKIRAIKRSLEKTPESKDTEAIRIQFAEDLKKAVDDLRKKADDATIEAATSFDKTSLMGSAASVDISRALYNRLSQAERDSLSGVLQFIKTTQEKANDKNTSPIDSKALQEQADAAREKLVEELRRKGIDSGKEAGKAFASGVKDAFANAFSGALKGQKEDNRTILLTMYDRLLDSTTNSVIDTFSKSMSDRLLGEGSGLSVALTSLGTGISNSVTTLFSSLSGVGGTALSAVSGFLGMKPESSPEASSDANAVPTLFNGIITAVSTLGTMLGIPLGIVAATSVSSQITDALGVTIQQAQLIYLGTLGIVIPAAVSVGSALIVTAIVALSAAILGTKAADAGGDLMSLFFAADGGKVTGPGSSRSDSVPAMLSNGEFVINARSAGKYMPLLSAINSGRMSHFADGGLVSPVNIATIDSSRSSRSGGGTSNFNINITGDVSNQTRSEIQRMIPQIAAGVNGVNYEQGRRR